MGAKRCPSVAACARGTGTRGGGQVGGGRKVAFLAMVQPPAPWADMPEILWEEFRAGVCVNVWRRVVGGGRGLGLGLGVGGWGGSNLSLVCQCDRRTSPTRHPRTLPRHTACAQRLKTARLFPQLG